MKKPLNALVLEDSEDDALLIVRELGRQGFEVKWERAGSAPAMKARLDAGSWDVVLSDNKIPGFGANAALRLLQETGLDLPFIVISGAIGEEAAVALMREGAHDYLLKEDLHRLGAVVERELRDARIRREHRAGIEKVRHLNRVLAAIRNVNQLVVTEKDRDRLPERACACLVETRGYEAAWIALFDDHGQPVKVAGRGYGEAWEELSCRVATGDLPACAAAALTEPEVVCVIDRSEACTDCIVHRSVGDHQGMAARIEHQGRLLGVLAVTLTAAVPVDESETSLLKEMAGDLGLALHGIDQQRDLDAARALSDAAIESMPDSFILFDPHTDRILRSNAQFRSVTGYTGEELAALPATQAFVTSTDIESVQDSMEKPGQSGREQMELNLRTKDGRLVPMEFRAATIPGPAPGRDLYLAIGRDLTERRRAEAQLRASERRYRALFEGSRDALMTFSPSSEELTACNPAAAELFGAPDEASFLARGPWELSPERQPDGRRSADAAKEMLETALDAGSCFFHWTHRRFSGQDFPAAVLLTRTEVDGAVLLQATVRDQTEIRKLQASIAQSDRLASMGMLAAGVAHEINNPLAYVLFNLESVAEDLPRLSVALRKHLSVVGQHVGRDAWTKLLGADQQLLNPAMLEDIQARFRDALDGTHRIRAIARGLGTFSRVDQDRLMSVNLMHPMEVAINLVFNEIKYRARLVKDYGRTAAVLASDGRLSQVFLNLLVNASHAIPEGNVEHNEIRVRTWQEGDEVFAEVRDTGKGIAKEHLPRLFDPFFTTKAAGVGTGLGLSISKSIVEGYGGRIDVSSTVGEGTRFVVRLPIQPEEAPREPASSAPEPDAAAVRGRILVIDDEAAIRTVLQRMLGREHDVVTASSGTEGRRILEEDTDFDLVLCDMMMPEMSGADLNQWLLQAHPALARNLVFVTGGAFTPRAREHLQQSENLMVQKPFDTQNLIKMVRELVQASKSRKAG